MHSGVRHSVHYESNPNIPRRIIRYADENSMDIIDMGTGGQNTAEMIYRGSTSYGVIENAHCPLFA